MIVGFIFFMGLSVPAYFTGVPWIWFEAHALRFDPQWIADIIQTIGSTGMAVTAILGLLLDNLLPGTPEERGLVTR